MSRCLSLLVAGLTVLAGCSKSPSESATTASKHAEHNHAAQDHAAQEHAGQDPAGTDASHAHADHEHAGQGHAGQEHAAPAADPHAAQPESDSHVEPASYAASSDALAPAADAPPESVVTAFLEAARRGDDRLAASLLSQKAVEETTKMGLAVKPPGTPTMEYSIEEVEYPEAVPHGAYVHSRWSERFSEGGEPFRVTWVLRKQASGWRIVGMAAELAENDPPYFLNFEQPQDLYRRLQEAGADVASPEGAASTPHMATEQRPLTR